MEVSTLTLRVLLLFFPGVLCALLVDALTVHRERTAAQFLTHAFVLGLASYLLLYAGRWACAEVADALRLPAPPAVTFIDALLNDRLRIAWGELVLAAATALPLGMLISAGINHTVLYRIGRWLRITRRRGTADLWSYVLDSSRTRWISVRDLEHGFTYFGAVLGYSETVELAELWLRDVVVYESATGARLYEASTLYLSQDPRSITIEVMVAEPQSAGGDGQKGRYDEVPITPRAFKPGGKDEGEGRRILVETGHVPRRRVQARAGAAAAELHPGTAEAAADAGDGDAQPGLEGRRAALKLPMRVIPVRLVVLGGAAPRKADAGGGRGSMGNDPPTR